MTQQKMATAFRTEASCLLLFYAVIRGLKFQKLAIVWASEADLIIQEERSRLSHSAGML